mmetsp:Transcript_9418/g.22676  ORF Transcript_9418/g.22676 Transcript_9418/m.22676 type:complete len:220 (-) Transcript_9418:82-741(-)
MSSLDEDADELLMLTRDLATEHGSEGIVIIGHSTGCQDAVRYAQRFRRDAEAPPLMGVVLQAPVSDREFLSTMPRVMELTPRAREMVAEGRGEDVLARDIFGEGTPSFMSARRFLSLAERGGDDDMFSSDLTDGELGGILGCLSGTPTLVLVSGDDECVPPHVDKAATAGRMCRAIGPAAELVVVEGACHSLAGKEDEAADRMLRFCLQAQRLRPPLGQ